MITTIIIIIFLIIGLPLITGIYEVKDMYNTKIVKKSVNIEITDEDDINMIQNLKEKQDAYNIEIQCIQNINKDIYHEINKKNEEIDMINTQIQMLVNEMPDCNRDILNKVYVDRLDQIYKQKNKLEFEISKSINKIVDLKIKSDNITKKLDAISRKYL